MTLERFLRRERSRPAIDEHKVTNRWARVALLISLLLGSIGGSLGAGRAVHAAPSGCTTVGYLCVWTSTYYTGNKQSIYYSNHSWYGLLVYHNDNSWFNNGTQNVCVFHGDYAVPGHVLTVPLSAGTGYQYGGTYPAVPSHGWGDSNRWIGSNPCSAY